MKIRLSTLLLVPILLSQIIFLGCVGLEEDPTANWSAEELYTNAKGRLNDKYYEQSVQLYKSLDLRYPYGPFAEQGKIDIAYAYWKMDDNTSALIACDRFIREHPEHKYSDYMMYLKASVYFNDDKGLFGMLLSKNLAERDPGSARQAFDTLRDLVKRFPESRYAEDARLRMAYLVNTLAEHETGVAEYYYQRGAYVASINRAQSVIETYPKAPDTPRALQILAASYEKSGLLDAKIKIDTIIALNFPGLQAAKAEDADSAWWDFWSNKAELSAVDISAPDADSGKPWWKFWVDDGKPPQQ
ncbi:MAG: outer membrane protein assembly factor BamD [Proteobacteria bacterium]|nr:outer membrane protein assembly factor BamD [Pseudomonadota bacterium]MDA1331980.1 outer membrane protein assembly factor BamD [Pseudomonadota bacterium]